MACKIVKKCYLRFKTSQDMDKNIISICCAEDMISAVRHFGIIPLFKSGVPGWSVEEMTPPEHWFYTSEELGPWDWKIEVVNEGDIAYGKFLGGKAAFATTEFYAHLMNWRRSLPKYRVALGERHPDKTRSGKLMRALSPAALNLIREQGSADSTQIRKAASDAVTPTLIRSMGASYKSNLVPGVKKSICDTIMQFLEMGTWTVIGNITRVYRGANSEYSGWQKCSRTTPENLFDGGDSKCGETSAPFWAKFVDDGKSSGRPSLKVDCSPEESRAFLIRHICAFFPGNEEALAKII